jgi:hypothetical protein
MDVLQQTSHVVAGFLFDPERFYGVEVPLYMELTLEDGRVCRVTGRADYMLVDDDEGYSDITDLKSQWNIPSDAAMRDDTQQKIYSTMAITMLPELVMAKARLLLTRYGFFVPQQSEALWVREELEAFRDEHITPMLSAFYRGDLRDEYIPGLHCQYCPRRRPGDCTLWRSYYGNVPPPPTSEQQARKLARQVMALEEARDVRLSHLKAYVNEHGPLKVGSGKKAETFGYHVNESDEYDAAEVFEVLSDPDVESLVGAATAHFSGVFRVDRSGKAFKQLDKALQGRLRDLAQKKRSTRFEHKVVEE